jgi:RimJ/RimL family protein N-acetyltransferase
MVASYIKPPYRRQGLTRLLYEARIQWAKEQNDIHTLIMHHRSDNEISRKAHQKFKFEFIKEFPPTDWPNGEIKPYVEYRLKIK